MTVDSGMALLPEAVVEQPGTWVDRIESSLPVLQGHIRRLWVPNHFLRVDNPAHEAKIILTYLATRYPELVGPCRIANPMHDFRFDTILIAGRA